MKFYWNIRSHRNRRANNKCVTRLTQFTTCWAISNEWKARVGYHSASSTSGIWEDRWSINGRLLSIEITLFNFSTMIGNIQAWLLAYYLINLLDGWYYFQHYLFLKKYDRTNMTSLSGLWVELNHNPSRHE